ncbi:hypothetical protein BJP34_16715 [Moorena producens PAL-8-15-08-1]|uniref:eCIS core domain-containing protein n=1 Tax=Moorena producens PAL-8-15-08-1 TaxID=1458985 RepID=A0A1D8TTC3_9CYAN|nr:DUF4157 domain-containing protein [Moorena producens]AOX00867.1 hypothetical protein BJP34_16715 [Moorena producens PAL-8-15-08-1]
MTRQYDVRRSSESPQKDDDNWILQRSAVRELPAKPKTPQTASHDSVRSGNKLDLLQIPVSNYSAMPVQAKLEIGSADDKYEQEADRIAAEVTSRLNGLSSETTSESQRSNRSLVVPLVQKYTALSPTGTKEGEAISPELEASIQQAKGGGNPLQKSLRSKMEQAFGGADFGRVKIHTGTEGDRLNRDIHARAFTTGQDIFFRQGEYNPASYEGQGLLAHELTHVLQQKLNKEPRSNNGECYSVSSTVNKVQRANGSKRKLSEAREAVDSEEWKEWVEQEKNEKSYFDDKKVHKIQKGNKKDLACWNWALSGLDENSSPSPQQVWNVLIGLTKESEEDAQKWMSQLSEEVHKDLKEIVKDISKAKLSVRPNLTLPLTKQKAQQNQSREILKKACEQIVKAHKMEVVEDEKAKAWVVCQYKKEEGVAVPEHWWIELPEDIVIQTVPGQPIEVGGLETKFHAQGGRLEEDALQYGEIRTPVKDITQKHKQVLIDAMNKARKKIKK